MASERFTIDDAFQSDDEDPIRIYGSTNESAPLRQKKKLGDLSQASRESEDSIDSKLDSLNRAGSSYSFSSQLTDSYTIATKTYPEKYWWRHPKVRENWKIVLASFLLFLLGLTLIVVGIVIEATQAAAIHSVLFFIAGVICLIPGAYHVVYIYCAVKGKKGFSFYNMPVFK